MQMLCTQHEAALKQYQNTVVTPKVSVGGISQYDRFQFLLSVIAAVRTEPMIHIGLLNCPLPSFAVHPSS